MCLSCIMASKLFWMPATRCSQAAFESDVPVGVISLNPVWCTAVNHATQAHSARAVAVEVSREYAMSNGLRGSRMIQLPLLCISRRAASGRHLRRVLTGRCRVGLAHLILRNRCADGGARAGVRWPARMGLVGRDGQPKIAILQQVLFRIERLSDRGVLSALVALGAPRHGGMIAPMRLMLA